MDQNPVASSYANLSGIKTTVLTYDPLLMGSVQQVPPPPSIKPLPPSAPPPPNATVYNPTKDVETYIDDYSTAHNKQAYDDTETDETKTDQQIIDYAESVWSNNQYKMYDYNKFDAFTGQYSIDPNFEPPLKRRKLTDPDFTPSFDNSEQHGDRYSLKSLGFQPLAARAILEKLDCQPKLRYAEEFHRDITKVMQYETNVIAQKLNKDSIQNIYPTSNGRSKNYLYTKCGINPNDKISLQKLRAHLLSKSISTMIYTKQKQDIDSKIHTLLDEKQKETDIMQKAQEKSLEIAQKLGFVPQFLKNTENVSNINSDAEYDHEDGEIKETDPGAKKLKQLQESNKEHTQSNIKTEESTAAAIKPTNFKEIEEAKRLLNPGMAPPPIQRQSAFTRFECKSVLKSDGSEYDTYLGSKMCGVKKYDSHFRPMFPITNKEYTFSVVSAYGMKQLRKYGYKGGDGLGKHKQGITTFPRLSGQHSLKGINYAERNRKNLMQGFIHCTACDKAFCGYSNLQTHIISKKHKKNLAIKPNNLVLLCVQCQLQFPTAQKIKEHFMLVQHDESIPGIAAFEKQLRDELRSNQIRYIQNLKTQPNPFKKEKDDQKDTESDEKSTTTSQVKKKEAPPTLPLPYTQHLVQPTRTAKTNAIPMTNPYQLYATQYNQAMAAYQQQWQQVFMQYNQQHAHTGVASAAHTMNAMTTAMTGVPAYNPRTITAVRPPTAIEIAIDVDICNDIKHKIYTLGLKLPMAVPTVPWMYCPSCKSFFTTFLKFNEHYETQRHVVSMNALSEDGKNKMKELFQYIKQKQDEHLMRLQ